jgi:5'-nucleotidase
LGWHENGIRRDMKILITNDDGIYSPGIAALAKVAMQFGEVRIVAPDVEQSSMGHAITHSRPLSYKKSPIVFDDLQAFRVNGTPADCVSLGLHLDKTDVVLSGINMGPNLGNSMWHSGTLAGAKQAVLLGVTGIALSVPVGKTEPDFEAMAPNIASTLEKLFSYKDLNLFNVNFPVGESKDIKWTRQSVRLYDGVVIPGIDPLGRKHYWCTVSAMEAADEGTDRWAVENNYTSITPLRLDLTDELQLKEIMENERSK